MIYHNKFLYIFLSISFFVYAAQAPINRAKEDGSQENISENGSFYRSGDTTPTKSSLIMDEVTTQGFSQDDEVSSKAFSQDDEVSFKYHKRKDLPQPSSFGQIQVDTPVIPSPVLKEKRNNLKEWISSNQEAELETKKKSDLAAKKKAALEKSKKEYLEEWFLDLPETQNTQVVAQKKGAGSSKTKK